MGIPARYLPILSRFINKFCDNLLYVSEGSCYTKERKYRTMFHRNGRGDSARTGSGPGHGSADRRDHYGNGGIIPSSSPGKKDLPVKRLRKKRGRSPVEDPAPAPARTGLFFQEAEGRKAVGVSSCSPPVVALRMPDRSIMIPMKAQDPRSPAGSTKPAVDGPARIRTTTAARITSPTI
jgi:hypothetical protein